jgi:hypothetical protein
LSARFSVDWQLRNFLASSICGISRVLPHFVLCLLTHRIGFLFLSQICLSPASLSVGLQLAPSPLAPIICGISSIFQHLILCFSTHTIGFPSSSQICLSPAILSEGLASHLSSLEHFRSFQCFSTLHPVFLNTHHWFTAWTIFPRARHLRYLPAPILSGFSCVCQHFPFS